MAWIRGCGMFIRMAFTRMPFLPSATGCGGIGVSTHSDGMAILIITIIGAGLITAGRSAGADGGAPIIIGMPDRIGIMGRAIGDVPLTMPIPLAGRMALGPCREAELLRRVEWLRAFQGSRFVGPAEEVRACAAAR